MSEEQKEGIKTSDLPIGTPMLVSDHENARAVFLRFSEDEGVYRVLSKPEDKEVLVMKVSIHTGANSMRKIDRDWWTIRVDGQAIGTQVMPHRYRNLSAQVPEQTVEIRT